MKSKTLQQIEDELKHKPSGIQAKKYLSVKNGAFQIHQKTKVYGLNEKTKTIYLNNLKTEYKKLHVNIKDSENKT